MGLYRDNYGKKRKLLGTVVFTSRNQHEFGVPVVSPALKLVEVASWSKDASHCDSRQGASSIRSFCE